jgi:multidrug efflux pump subunit AcrB
LFREFAVTLAVTILVSAGVSLSLDADDVRQTAQASQGRREGPLLRSHRGFLQPHHRVLRTHRESGSETPDGDLASSRSERWF